MILQRAEFIDRDERDDVEVVDMRIVVGDGGEVVGGWMVEQSYLGHKSRILVVASSSIHPRLRKKPGSASSKSLSGPENETQ